MKKFFLFVAMLVVGTTAAIAQCQDGPYGLKINGSTVVDAPKFGDPDAQGRVQYKASCVALKVGDEIQLVNQSCDATWMVDVDPYGEYQKFEGGKNAGKLTCKEAGSYDFYIKLSASAGDLVYIGAGENCSSDPGTNPGTNPGTTTSEDAYWYWKGYVDGVDLNNEIEGGLFDGGISEITVNDKGYIFVVYQVHGVPGVQYMAAAYSEATHCTMLTSGGEKLMIPAGTYTLYLYDNGDGTVELSREPLAGKTLVGGGKSAVENTTIHARVSKTIINGQVVIIKDGIRYNLLGAQLQ